MKRLDATVHGHVHGVYFRATTCRRAQTLALTGWVRNQPDGTVRVIAEGQEEALRALLFFLEQGPPQAYVTEVRSIWGTATGEFSHFSVHYP